MASPKLFTKEFNPQQPPNQPAAAILPAAQAAGTVPFPLGGGATAAAKGIPLSLGGGKPGGLNVTPQLIQQLLASASKVGTRTLHFNLS